MMNLDEWQKQVLATEGNICLRSGRQVGKSTVISIKAGEFAVNNFNKVVMIIAATERQAYLLFSKVLDYLERKHRTAIKTGKDRPTKTKIQLKNNSTIYCLPTGITGLGIRGYTVDLLIADEAAFIPEEVWSAVTPMLAVTKGKQILLSTPHGKQGYYYECFDDPTFTSFHVSSEECQRITKEYLAEQRRRMTRVQYAQEFLGEFVDELRQFFPTSIIKQCMIIHDRKVKKEYSWDYFLGVDVARMGEDDTVLFSVARTRDKRIVQMDMEITNQTLLTETIRRIKNADERYNYKKIYIDDGGMGVGVFDPLLEDPQTRRKVIAINNAKRSLELDKEKKAGAKKGLLKEDIYNNALKLMEENRVALFNEVEILISLKSVQAEYDKRGRIRIFGDYTHIAEAMVRACYCTKDKSLNIWIDSM